MVSAMAGEVSTVSTGREKPVVREPVASAKSVSSALRAMSGGGCPPPRVARLQGAVGPLPTVRRGARRNVGGHHDSAGMEFLPTPPGNAYSSRMQPSRRSSLRSEPAGVRRVPSGAVPRTER